MHINSLHSHISWQSPPENRHNTHTKSKPSHQSILVIFFLQQQQPILCMEQYLLSKVQNHSHQALRCTIGRSVERKSAKEQLEESLSSKESLRECESAALSPTHLTCCTQYASAFRTLVEDDVVLVVMYPS